MTKSNPFAGVNFAQATSQKGSSNAGFAFSFGGANSAFKANTTGFNFANTSSVSSIDKKEAASEKALSSEPEKEKKKET